MNKIIYVRKDKTYHKEMTKVHNLKATAQKLSPSLAINNLSRPRIIQTFILVVLHKA